MDRLEAVRKAMANAKIDALWVSQPENIRYLSGFSEGHDAKILVLANEAILYTDSRFILHAAQESVIPQHICRISESYAHAAEKLSSLSLGFEEDSLTVAMFSSLEQNMPETTLVATTNLIENLRLIKDPTEIQCIKESQALSDRVYSEIRPLIKAGTPEVEITAEIEVRLRRAGASAAFEPIVVSGVRGALPHGRASSKKIQEGELVTIDMGAMLGGYVSDMTRTVAVGEPNAEMRRVYNAVLEAEQTALGAIRPGISCYELDKIARDILTNYDLGTAFTHSLGHGVGMYVHEMPRLSKTSTDILQAGMVITIEPGAYLPGIGGVRIEDLVLVTESGYEVLSSSPIEAV